MSIAYLRGYLSKCGEDPRSPTMTVRAGPLAVDNVPRPSAALDLLKSYAAWLRARLAAPTSAPEGRSALALQTRVSPKQ